MNADQNFEKDLSSIRQLMERSVKFISFSGLSGILAGVYALIGAAVGYNRLIGASIENLPAAVGCGEPNNAYLNDVVVIAVVVLIASLTTGLWISARKAKRLGVSVWDDTGKRMFINLGIPLLSGGIFMILLLLSDHFDLLAPVSLIFYGLALINASPNLVNEIRYLGYCEVLLGLAATAFPKAGPFLWAAGFGVLHILYGSILFRKYK